MSFLYLRQKLYQTCFGRNNNLNKEGHIESPHNNVTKRMSNQPQAMECASEKVNAVLSISDSDSVSVHGNSSAIVTLFTSFMHVLTWSMSPFVRAHWKACPDVASSPILSDVIYDQIQFYREKSNTEEQENRNSNSRRNLNSTPRLIGCSLRFFVQ